MSRQEFHRRFGGLLYETDYSAGISYMSNMAKRIEADMEFDETCKKNSLLKERGEYGS